MEEEEGGWGRLGHDEYIEGEEEEGGHLPVAQSKSAKPRMSAPQQEAWLYRVLVQAT